MGVELRVHLFFPLLALVCMAMGSADGFGYSLGIFLILCLAVLVRDTARLVVAAWLGLKLRALLLLPIGGLFAWATPESQEQANEGSGQFALALAGPIANLATAAVLAFAFLGAGGNVNLFAQPWIGTSSLAALLRSAVWLQVGLGLLHLLPAYPLDGGRLLRGRFARTHGFAPGARTAASIGLVLAMAAIEYE